MFRGHHAQGRRLGRKTGPLWDLRVEGIPTRAFPNHFLSTRAMEDCERSLLVLDLSGLPGRREHGE